MADNEDQTREAAKRQLAADREVSERSRAEFVERMKGKPTPTQEENDLAALGAHVVEKEDDGSGPDPNIVKNLENRPGAATRQTQAAKPAPTPRNTPPRSE